MPCVGVCWALWHYASWARHTSASSHRRRSNVSSSYRLQWLRRSSSCISALLLYLALVTGTPLSSFSRFSSASSTEPSVRTTSFSVSTPVPVYRVRLKLTQHQKIWLLSNGNETQNWYSSKPKTARTANVVCDAFNVLRCSRCFRSTTTSFELCCRSSDSPCTYMSMFTYQFYGAHLPLFSARQHICSACYMLSPVRLSICLSVRLSVTRVDQSKMVEIRIMPLSHIVAQSL